MSNNKKGIPLSEAHKAALRGVRGPKEKIRQSKLGNNNPNFGKPRSEETRKKISEAQRGISRKPHSEKTRAKMRAAHAARLITLRLC